MDEIKIQLKDYIAKNILFNPQGYPYPDDASFMEEGIVDSVGIMELIAFIEDNYAIVVDNTHITPQNFDTVTSLAAYVAARGGSGKADG